eukprot:365608-Chlamydomonas_euryale.AAC.1
MLSHQPVVPKWTFEHPCHLLLSSSQQTLCKLPPPQGGVLRHPRPSWVRFRLSWCVPTHPSASLEEWCRCAHSSGKSHNVLLPWRCRLRTHGPSACMHANCKGHAWPTAVDVCPPASASNRSNGVSTSNIQAEVVWTPAVLAHDAALHPGPVWITGSCSCAVLETVRLCDARESEPELTAPSVQLPSQQQLQRALLHGRASVRACVREHQQPARARSDCCQYAACLGSRGLALQQEGLTATAAATAVPAAAVSSAGLEVEQEGARGRASQIVARRPLAQVDVRCHCRAGGAIAEEAHVRQRVCVQQPRRGERSAAADGAGGVANDGIVAANDGILAANDGFLAAEAHVANKLADGCSGRGRTAAVGIARGSGGIGSGGVCGCGGAAQASPQRRAHPALCVAKMRTLDAAVACRLGRCLVVAKRHAAAAAASAAAVGLAALFAAASSATPASPAAAATVAAIVAAAPTVAAIVPAAPTVTAIVAAALPLSCNAPPAALSSAPPSPPRAAVGGGWPRAHASSVSYNARSRASSARVNAPSMANAPAPGWRVPGGISVTRRGSAPAVAAVAEGSAAIAAAKSSSAAATATAESCSTAAAAAGDCAAAAAPPSSAAAPPAAARALAAAARAAPRPSQLPSSSVIAAAAAAWPRSRAKCAGGRPSAPGAATSAPHAARVRSTSQCPPAAAAVAGVEPECARWPASAPAQRASSCRRGARSGASGEGGVEGRDRGAGREGRGRGIEGAGRGRSIGQGKGNASEHCPPHRVCYHPFRKAPLPGSPPLLCKQRM